MFYSIYGTSVGFEEFHLQKNRAIIKFLQRNISFVIHRNLKKKGAKFWDDQDLASKYDNLWFYKNLVADDDKDDTYED